MLINLFLALLRFIKLVQKVLLTHLVCFCLCVCFFPSLYSSYNMILLLIAQILRKQCALVIKSLNKKSLKFYSRTGKTKDNNGTYASH